MWILNGHFMPFSFEIPNPEKYLNILDNERREKAVLKNQQNVTPLFLEARLLFVATTLFAAR